MFEASPARGDQRLDRDPASGARSLTILARARVSRSAAINEIPTCALQSRASRPLRVQVLATSRAISRRRAASASSTVPRSTSPPSAATAFTANVRGNVQCPGDHGAPGGTRYRGEPRRVAIPCSRGPDESSTQESARARRASHIRRQAACGVLGIGRCVHSRHGDPDRWLWRGARVARYRTGQLIAQDDRRDRGQSNRAIGAERSKHGVRGFIRAMET